MQISKQIFGYLNQSEKESEAVYLYRIKNAGGCELELLELGARIHSLSLPDRDGRSADVVQGFSTLAAYQNEGRYHGAVCGPFANRIAGARVRRKGQDYPLPNNEGGNCLHSGPGAFHARLWKSERLADGLRFSLEAPEGYGFPGGFRCEVCYRLSEDHTLSLTYQLFALEDCLFSPTNHVFLNLRGRQADDLGAQELSVQADFFTPTDSALLTTGEVRPVKGTAWDFREPRGLKQMLAEHETALAYSRGYDQNFVLRKSESGALEEAACLYEPESGRGLRLLTTQAGLQVYTANFPPAAVGRNGRPYPAHSALCLETQGFPNSPAHTHFPSAWVRAGQLKEESSHFKFFVD